MNETNWNEKQLRSWQPRRASAGLKDRIFDAEHPKHTAKWLWGALVPATACALLTVLSMNRNGESLENIRPMSLACSNLNDGLLAPEARQSAQNHSDFITFDSTNKSFFTSNMRFTPKTNFSNE